MSVHDISKNKNKHRKNAYSTLTSLNFVLKIFGLYCISNDGRKFKYSWPIWKIVLTAAVFLTINSICIYFAVHVSNRKKARFQDYFILIYMLGYTQYIVDLTFVYKYGRQRCLDYYDIFENIDRAIGMPYYNEIKRKTTKICIFFVFIGTFYFISDYSALVLVYGWFISAVHSIDYIYTAIKMLSALDGVAHVTQVKYRLKRIEDVLRNYYRTIANLPGVTKDVVCKKDWAKTLGMDNRLDCLSTIGYVPSSVIFDLSKCYLLLLEQCDYINGMFGFRILLGGLVYLMEMVMLVNLMIRLTIGSMIPYYRIYWILPILSTAMKIVNYSSILLCGINCCEQCYKQTDRIVSCIDYLMANKKLTPEAHDALKELRELIISRPVSFSALNFYTLDYPTMLAMASAVVTYTIILLQNMQ